MSLSEQLKLLANGINPETGEVLEEGSLTSRAEVMGLAEELSGIEKHTTNKPKLTLEERRQKNISEGRPPKSHFPWDEEEKSKLACEFAQRPDAAYLSSVFERSSLAIAAQLQKMKLISEEEVGSYR